MKRFRLLHDALLEVLEALRYYRSQAPNLGAAFIQEVKAAILDVAENPEQWAVVRPPVRRRLVHRFPYSIVYRIDPEEIVVVAVMHMHRHPTYWAGRI